MFFPRIDQKELLEVLIFPILRLLTTANNCGAGAGEIYGVFIGLYGNVFSFVADF